MQICARNVHRDNSLKMGPDDTTEEEYVGGEGRNSCAFLIAATFLNDTSSLTQCIGGVWKPSFKKEGIV